MANCLTQWTIHGPYTLLHMHTHCAQSLHLAKHSLASELRPHIYNYFLFLFHIDIPSSVHFSLCSDETYVIGFLVPNQKQLLALADQYSIRGSWEELCNSKAMEELVLKAITETALAGKMLH